MEILLRVSTSEKKLNPNGAGRKMRLRGRPVTSEEMYDEIRKFIDEGITGTKALGDKIGKKESQTKRYLLDMGFRGLVDLDPITGRLIKTKKQQDQEFDARLLDDKFTQIPSIKKFIYECRTKGNSKNTISSYISSLKKIFRKMKTNPDSVILSKESAQGFFKNYKAVWIEEHPNDKEPSQSHRTAYRIFLGNVGSLSYPHGGAKGFGFGSHHKNFQKYKEAHIPVDVFYDLSKMILEDKEYAVYTWLNTAVMTAGRSGAIASMTWDRINLFKEDFRIDQFETKDNSAGHEHLGELGEWKHKYPPVELYEILLDWKNNHAPKNSKFVWFEDKEKDVSNRRQCEVVRNEIIPKLKEYLEKVRDRLSPITQEYVFKAGRAGHLNRHTFAQLLRNKGLSNSEIAFAGGWKSAQTVDWYCGISEDEKVKARKAIADAFVSPKN